MRRAAHNAMTGLMVGGLLSLLFVVSMSVATPAEASPAGAAPAGPAVTAAGGWTYSGTVTAKSYVPPRAPVVQCVGRQCRKVPVPECWRLDLRKWVIFTGWVCVPAAQWATTQIGDRV